MRSAPRVRRLPLSFEPLAGAAPGTDGREIQRHGIDLETGHRTRLLLAILKRSYRQCGDTREIIVASHLYDNACLFGGAGSRHAWEAHGISKLAFIHH